MAEMTVAENRDMYRSYIQRRRVVPEKTEQDTLSGYSTEKEDDSADSNDLLPESGTNPVKSAITDAEELSILREKYRSDEGNSGYSNFTRNPEEKSRNWPLRLFGSKNTPYKTDSYRSYPSYGYSQSSYGYASRNLSYGRNIRAQSGWVAVEDNRASMLAIKIIKQTLVCFVLLGIIVFMQQNADMADELSVIRKHVVETHIEFDSIINGVKNIVAECSRIFGGSP